MHRVKEVIDCWYDSGSMPFAQWHYPFENKEMFEKRFPADFISEAIDQTRGWFYTLLAISTLMFDRAPFENCLVLGHVQDKDGQQDVQASWATSSIPGRCWTSRARTPCAGISTPPARRGCPAASPRPTCPSASASSWARSGTPIASIVLYADIDQL